MTIPSWPSIAHPSIPISEETPNVALLNKQDNGFSISRPRAQRMPKTWGMEWPAMTNADYILLDAFYVAVFGGCLAFSWTDETHGVSRVVRFAEKLSGEIVAWNTDQKPKHWHVRVTLEEV